MKNISSILSGASLIAVIILFVLHFNAKKDYEQKISELTKIQQRAAVDELPIAYVNMDTVLMNYAMFGEKQKLILEKQRKFEANLAEKKKAFEKRAAKFQEDLAKHLITRRQAEDEQAQLMQEEQRFMQTKDEFSNQLIISEQEMNQAVYDSIRSYLQSHNKDQKYKLIISNSAGGNLLHGDIGLDLTKYVIEGINRRYLKEDYDKYMEEKFEAQKEEDKK